MRKKKKKLRLELYGSFCKQQFCDNMCDVDKDDYTDINECYSDVKMGTRLRDI